MKTVSTALLNHIAGNETTLAIILKIERTDGVVYAFTSHDKDIEYQSVVYKANASFIPTSFMQAANLAVDNIDITGFVDDEIGISENDLMSEFLYNAKISMYQINYKDKTMGDIKLLYGSLGAVRPLKENTFTIEFRNLTYKLTKKLSDLFSKTCRVELGSTKCGVTLEPSSWLAETEYYINDIITPSVDNDRQYVCIQEGASDITEPTWTTTIDDEITDGEVIWKCKDLYVKSGEVLAPNKFRFLVTKASPNLYISEIKFFDSTDTRVYPIACSSNPSVTCANVSDNAAGTSILWSNPTNNWIEFTFSSEFVLKTFQIDLINASYINECYMQVSYDAGVTWNNIYILKNSTKAFWHLNSYSYLVPITQIVFAHRSIFVPSTIYEDMNFFTNGVITWTSGKNTGLSMEVKKYDATSNTIKLFKGMPYDIKPGDTFEATVGCNHLYLGSDGTTATGDCVSRFNNGINFRGEPFVPTEDVLIGGIGDTNKKPRSF